jgi:hypothetical protein
LIPYQTITRMEFFLLTWMKPYLLLVAVSSACPQNIFGSVTLLILERTMSSRVRFLLLETLFHYDVHGGVSCETIPHFFKYIVNS